MTVESTINVRWIIPFRKYDMIRVNSESTYKELLRYLTINQEFPLLFLKTLKHFLFINSKDFTVLIIYLKDFLLLLSNL